MIWFSIKKLEQKISSNRLSDREGLYYLLANIIFGYMLAILNRSIDSVVITATSLGSHLKAVNLSRWVVSVISISIYILAILICYKINSAIDDRDFLKRFFSIHWVVTIRLLVFYYLVLMLILLVFFDLAKLNSVQKVTIYCAQSIIFYFFYLRLMLKSFKRLKSNIKS